MRVGGKETEVARASLELLYSVSRELASALDLRAVLTRVAYLCISNVGATNGSIIVLDEHGKPIDSVVIVKGVIQDHDTQQLADTFEKGLAGWVARQRIAVLVPDTSLDERWLRRPDDAADRSGPKSAVSAPILAHDQLIGVITLVHPQPGTFNEDHLVLVKAIADQAGIAILNARLYAESQRQARAMTAIAGSAAAINSSLNQDEVFQRILEQTSQALRVETAALALIHPQTHELIFRATTDSDQGILGMRLALGQGIAGWVAKQGVGVIVPDAYDDPRFEPGFDQKLNFKTRVVACAPIRSQGNLIGVLEVINPLDGSFEPDALQVLEGICSLAGAAIRHAQLFERSQSAQERYRGLFEDSIDPILVTDWQGRIVEANRQAEVTSGLSRQALQKLRINSLHKVDASRLGSEFQHFAARETISYESRLKTKAGGEIPIQVYVHKIVIDGKPHLQWILRDISERKHLDQLREDLVSMIYHDLRSPLANVVSSLDVMESLIAKDSDPSLRSMLQIALRSTERIQRLTESLLDISRLEAGQPVGNRKPNSPKQMIEDAIQAVQPLAQHKRLEIRTEVTGAPPDVFVDGEMIRRVLINLIENAVKFTPVGGTIVSGAKGDGGFVCMWVRDNGPGIPSSEHGRIFDKFARLHAKDSPRGLGLGLAFCRLAVLGHGGRIWVESEPGQGASFLFTLPIAAP